MGIVNWRDKDDLDLTSEDISAMAAEGQAVAVRGPHLPGNGIFISSADTYVFTTTVRPEVHRPLGRLVGVLPTVTAL